MKIRPYQQHDQTEVIELLKLNTPNFFAPSEEADFREYLNNEIEEYFVVLENNEIIGAGGINYFLEDKTARISWDLIKPEFQGKGIGRKLTEHRIQHLNKNHKVDLIVVRTTQLVFQFYEKMRFKTRRVEKDFWAKGFDLYEMELRNRG